MADSVARVILRLAQGLLNVWLFCAVLAPVFAASPTRSPSDDSGGVLVPEQAAYDVLSYDLSLQIFPERKRIRGMATVDVQVRDRMSFLVLDLDARLKVRAATLNGVRVAGGGKVFARHAGKLWLPLGGAVDPPAWIRAVIEYSGSPRQAVRAPWDGGFTWAKTPDGRPWIATSVQGEGADLWWPCKDHPSDEPENLTLRVRVPRPLVVAANGRLVEVIEHRDRTRTYHWHTAFPINNYGVALNIAPYETIETNYTSVTGETVPACFWVLPQNLERGRKLMPELLEHLNFYERTLGPYPFRAEKYGVAETPHLGMEHQTIIAYGNNYAGGPNDFDWLHHHELGHEWWGNLVTARDWRHFWLHEGLCTYMQALYAEEREGTMAYDHVMYNSRRRVTSAVPLVPEEPASMHQMDKGPQQDVYYKGAWIVHTLRFLIGKESTLQLLRRFAYPYPADERLSDGSVCRFVETADFVRLAEEIAGRELGWFFRLYLTQAALPRLRSEVLGDKLVVWWETPEGLSFPMPVEVQCGERLERVEMPGGRVELDAARYEDCRLDPRMRILRTRDPAPGVR